MSMKAIKRVHRSQEGSVLLGVCCFLFLATGLVATILVLGSNHRKISQRQVNMEQAMYVAEAGLERGARFMESNLVTIAASTGTNGSGSLGSGTYTFLITKANANTFNLVSTGTVNNVRRTVSIMKIYQPSYAEFALWSSNNASLYFKAGEEFEGHVHSDTKMYFNNEGGGPIFHSDVTSLASTYGGDITGIQFDEGLTLNSYQGSMADVDFNSTESTSLKNVATSTGLVLDGNTTITFNGGTVKITNSRIGWSNHVYNFSGEGIIYIKNSNTGTTSTRAGTAYLKGGKVNGRLTIVTETDMYIQGHITYNSDPEINPNSDDALGLISRDDVWVDTSAPDDLVIDAAIIAAGTSSSGNDGSFGVIDYDEDSPRGILNVYGGIVQHTRGAVGQFNSGTGATIHGFAKNYSYDKRFVNNPPPYYPTMANKVAFSQWREGR